MAELVVAPVNPVFPVAEFALELLAVEEPVVAVVPVVVIVDVVASCGAVALTHTLLLLSGHQ